MFPDYTKYHFNGLRPTRVTTVLCMRAVSVLYVVLERTRCYATCTIHGACLCIKFYKMAGHLWCFPCGAGKHQYFKIVIVTMMAISVEVKLIEKF